jgi:prepilin-type N-terminal cleavage/methylation domain-containing protein
MRVSRAFTVLELMVALALSGLVLLLAEGVFGGVLDALAQSAAARQSLNGEANARRLLGAVIGSVDVRSDSLHAFGGRPHEMDFVAWTVRERDWPREERFALADADDTLRLTSAWGTLALLPGVDSAAFDYLLNPGAETPWVRRWYSRSGPPVAARLRLFRGEVTDTLLLFIGVRG